MANYKNMIGDGKLPNRYWVSISNDYSYIHDENCIDWIGDLIPTFKSKGRTFTKGYTTYAGAKAFCDGLYLGQVYDTTVVNRINIEDRLSGELYEKTWIFDPEKATLREWENESIGFTKEKMGDSFK